MGCCFESLEPGADRETVAFSRTTASRNRPNARAQETMLRIRLSAGALAHINDHRLSKRIISGELEDVVQRARGGEMRKENKEIVWPMTSECLGLEVIGEPPH